LQCQSRLTAPDGRHFRRTLADYGVKEGADGLIVDAAGNLYAAVRDEARPGIRVYSPNGQEIDYIPTPETDKPAFEKTTILCISLLKSLYRVQIQHLN